MGKNFFLFEDIFNFLPFFNKFRVPMMGLMMFQFSIVIVSAIGLQHFIENINEKKHIQIFNYNYHNYWIDSVIYEINNS